MATIGRRRGRRWMLPAAQTGRRQTSAPVPETSAINFQALVEESVDVICQVRQMGDGQMRYEYVSPSAERVLGWTVEEMRGLRHADIYPIASMEVIREAGKRLDEGASSTIVTVEAIRKDGARIWVENRVRTVAGEGDGRRSVVVCMRDVTERKLLQDTLAKLVLVDALTSVGNRRAFDAALEREWTQAVERESTLTLMLIDVDHFKQINDTHGHQVGDECIKRVAQTVSQLLDRPEAFLARYGGDELAVLLPGLAEGEARTVGDRLCRGVAAAALLPVGDTVPAGKITISCGASTAWARLPVPARMPVGLIAAADRALYAAKSLGRNRAAVAPVA